MQLLAGTLHAAQLCTVVVVPGWTWAGDSDEAVHLKRPSAQMAMRTSFVSTSAGTR